VLPSGDLIVFAKEDAKTLLDAGLLVDVTDTWRTMYPDVGLYDGGGMIGGDGGPVLAVNEDPSLIPEMPQSDLPAQVAREMGELNDYLRQQTAEFWRQAEAAERETARKIEQIRADTQQQQFESRQRNQQIIDERDRQIANIQADNDRLNTEFHNQALAEYFRREDQKLLQALKGSLKAATANALIKAAGDLRAAGVGTGSGGGGAGTGAGSGSTGGAGSGSGKPSDKPRNETAADHEAHKAAGRALREAAQEISRSRGPSEAQKFVRDALDKATRAEQSGGGQDTMDSVRKSIEDELGTDKAGELLTKATDQPGSGNWWWLLAVGAYLASR